MLSDTRDVAAAPTLLRKRPAPCGGAGGGDPEPGWLRPQRIRLSLTTLKTCAHQGTAHGLVWRVSETLASNRDHLGTLAAARSCGRIKRAIDSIARYKAIIDLVADYRKR
jgi:hypothetical protein